MTKEELQNAYEFIVGERAVIKSDLEIAEKDNDNEVLIRCYKRSLEQATQALEAIGRDLGYDA